MTMDVAAFHERRLRLAAILAGWYGGGPKQSPHGRRIYVGGDRVRHLGDENESRQPPPSHDAGQAYLRSVLRDWRTEHAELAEWDAVHGGALRRCLVAAGLALQDETEDGRERADSLVREACHAASPRTLGRLDVTVARLAKMPKGPWRLVGSALSHI